MALFQLLLLHPITQLTSFLDPKARTQTLGLRGADASSAFSRDELLPTK